MKLYKLNKLDALKFLTLPSLLMGLCLSISLLLFSPSNLYSANSAECTPDATKMGEEAAQRACDEIVNGLGLLVVDEVPVSCIPEQVQACQTAMNEFLHRPNILARVCKTLIDRNSVVIYPFEEEDPSRTSQVVWQAIMKESCEIPGNENSP